MSKFRLADQIPEPDVSRKNQEIIEGYLAHKFGLADDLPEDHPYKHEPPRVCKGYTFRIDREDLDTVDRLNQSTICHNKATGYALGAVLFLMSSQIGIALIWLEEPVLGACAVTGAALGFIINVCLSIAYRRKAKRLENADENPN